MTPTPTPVPALPGAVETGPWAGFAMAADAVVRHLDATLGLDLWLVTAVQGEDQVVVASSGNWSGLAAPGTVFSWSESFCLRMIDRQGPTFAPDVRLVPAYDAAAAGVLSRVRAYVGVPLVGDDGELFGTLCAFGGEPQTDHPAPSMDVVVLVGRMLSTILAREQFARERSLEAVTAHALALDDAVTGLRNRRGWLRALEQEQERGQRYGSVPSVLALQVHRPEADGAPMDDPAPDAADPDAADPDAADPDAVNQDPLLRCAELLRSVSRPGDALGRVGGDEFGLLAVHCDAEAAELLLARVVGHLRGAGLAATAAVATHEVDEDLVDTWRRAQALRLADTATLPYPRDSRG